MTWGFLFLDFISGKTENAVTSFMLMSELFGMSWKFPGAKKEPAAGISENKLAPKSLSYYRIICSHF